MTTDVRWVFPNSSDEKERGQLCADLDIAPWLAELLVQRGFHETEKSRAFLQPRLRNLSDPFLLLGMEAVISRLLIALDNKERMVLYGDYDVDGVTSLAILTRVLKAAGADVGTFLPHRVDEGYGLTSEGVARCVEIHHPSLLIAVDCGTTSVEEIRALRAQGIDVIVLDHHEPKTELPLATAIVNPKLHGEFTYLCSAGLAFKVAHAFLKKRPVEGFDLKDALDLVALGTIADIVPLVDENRILAKTGLEKAAHSCWPGLRALIEVSGLKPPFSAGDVGFGLGPRLNAAGRVGTAEAALELLLTDDPERAMTLAKALDQQNRERRNVEDEVLAQAEAQLLSSFDPQSDAAIVVGDLGWHPGVLGIVASRLLRKHYRPTVVIGFDSSGLGKGSGRSIEGLSLVEAMTRCSDSLERFGGHEMAAGLTMRHENLKDFRSLFCKTVGGLLTREQLQPTLRLTCELRLSEIVPDLLLEHDALQPFGSKNAQPVFYARKVRLVGEPRVLKDKHLSFILAQSGSTAKALWWNAAEEVLPPHPWDVAFTVERNEWQGQVTAQLHIRAIRTTEPIATSSAS